MSIFIFNQCISVLNFRIETDRFIEGKSNSIWNLIFSAHKTFTNFHQTSNARFRIECKCTMHVRRKSKPQRQVNTSKSNRFDFWLNFYFFFARALTLSNLYHFHWNFICFLFGFYLYSFTLCFILVLECLLDMIRFRSKLTTFFIFIPMGENIY